jgi:methionyl-tRNA formyltransferase
MFGLFKPAFHSYVSNSLSLVFAGTPDFSVPVLDALLRSRHRVVAAYTQPDRPAGRGRQLNASAVKQFAAKHDLRIEQPATLKDPSALERLASWSADVMVVVAYGLLLPSAALQIPKRGCINVHASLLPRWRGAAPIQRALLAGDTQTGVTIMQMDVGLDTGDMLLTRSTTINAVDTSQSLHDRLSVLGAQALLETLDTLDAITPQPQPDQGVTYAHKLRKEEALIDWSAPASHIDRLIRAFNPWPVAETRWAGQQLRIWEAEPLATAQGHPCGEVLRSSTDGIDVATGEGIVRLKRVQLAGRKAMSAAEFARAHALQGVVLGA